MTQADREELDRVAYAYRTWPAADPAGVAQRFDDLCALVEKMRFDSYRMAIRPQPRFGDAWRVAG